MVLRQSFIFSLPTLPSATALLQNLEVFKKTQLQKTQLEQNLQQTSVLHVPPNSPSCPSFPKALHFHLQNVGPTIFYSSPALTVSLTNHAAGGGSRFLLSLSALPPLPHSPPARPPARLGSSVCADGLPILPRQPRRRTGGRRSRLTEKHRWSAPSSASASSSASSPASCHPRRPRTRR
jgi:hypothetical protein